MKLIAEYDSRTFNMGFIASFWDDRLEAMFELMAMKWVNFGVRYKLIFLIDNTARNSKQETGKIIE